MFFRRTEGKRWHPCLVITIGALAAAGAVSVTQKSKRWIKDKFGKVGQMLSKSED